MPNIIFLERSQLDTHAWDACIEKSAERTIYAFSWYLDIVTEKKWGAFVSVENTIYVAVMPVSLTKKYGLIPYSYQPIFVQQLGVYGISVEQTQNLLVQALHLLKKKFLFVQYHFNCSNEHAPQFLAQAKPLEIQNRITYQIPLAQGYEAIKKKYIYSRRRDLRKTEHIEVVPSEDISAVIEVFRAEKGREIAEAKDKHYAILETLFTELLRRKKVLLLVAKSPDNGKIMAGGVFLIDNPMITFLFSASSAEAKKYGTMTKILDMAIQHFAGQPLVFDFEGSMIETIAHFYRSFGSEPAHYTLWSYRIF
jgi:hypothetical protein